MADLEILNALPPESESRREMLAHVEYEVEDHIQSRESAVSLRVGILGLWQMLVGLFVVGLGNRPAWWRSLEGFIDWVTANPSPATHDGVLDRLVLAAMVAIGILLVVHGMYLVVAAATRREIPTDFWDRPIQLSVPVHWIGQRLGIWAHETVEEPDRTAGIEPSPEGDSTK